MIIMTDHEEAVLMVHQQLVEGEDAGAAHGGGEDGVGGGRGGDLSVPRLGESAVFAHILREEPEHQDETSQGSQRDGVAGHGDHLVPDWSTPISRVFPRNCYASSHMP